MSTRRRFQCQLVPLRRQSFRPIPVPNSVTGTTGIGAMKCQNPTFAREVRVNQRTINPDRFPID
jgi:hypothetical protein